jgi:hypothetical protein
MTSHTPTPWKVFAQGTVTEIQDDNGKVVISWMGFDDSGITLATHRANARLIVKAVNAYVRKELKRSQKKA